MPSSTRTWIADALNYIASWFRSLSYRFDDIADDAQNIPLVGQYIANAFYRVADYCYYIYGYFTDLRSGWLALCNWLDAVWDNLGDIWYDLNNLFNYVHIFFRDKIYEALNLANDAWNYAVDAYYTVMDIAGVIGTTFSQIVQFIRDYATIIYETIYNYVTNVYETVKNYITNVYETIYNYITNVYETVRNYITNVYQTIQNIYNTYVTEIIGASMDWVRDRIANALAAIAAPLNLVNLWFDDMQGFFNSPLDWLESKFGDWFFGPEK